MQPYRTIDEPAEGHFEDRGSHFYSFVARVKTEREAIEFRHGIMERIPEASHYVSAYIIHDECVTRCSDAKEPHGTAGQPVLSVLQGHNLSDVVCVVARVFGGTLLGKGGLMRAYTTAAQRAVEEAHVVLFAPCRDILASIPYSLYEMVRNRLESNDATILDVQFADDVTLDLRTRSEQADTLCGQIIDWCNGDAEFLVGDEAYALVDE